MTSPLYISYEPWLYSVFDKCTPLVLSHWKFATDKPQARRLGVYQWQTSSDLGLGLYICRIHLVAMVYILNIPLQAL